MGHVVLPLDFEQFSGLGVGGLDVEVLREDVGQFGAIPVSAAGDFFL